MPIIPLRPVTCKWPLAIRATIHDHVSWNHKFLISEKLNVVENYLTKLKKKSNFPRHVPLKDGTEIKRNSF
jgi:glutathione peroxidase-family protein